MTSGTFPTIGSEGEARLIADFAHGGDGLPMGWSYVASGSYRRVFLSPTGVVYKTETFNQVIAMPFYRGEDGPDHFAGAWDTQQAGAAEMMNLGDLHGGNVRYMDDGRLVVIDLNV